MTSRRTSREDPRFALEGYEQSRQEAASQSSRASSSATFEPSGPLQSLQQRTRFLASSTEHDSARSDSSSSISFSAREESVYDSRSLSSRAAFRAGSQAASRSTPTIRASTAARSATGTGTKVEGLSSVGLASVTHRSASSSRYPLPERLTDASLASTKPVRSTHRVEPEEMTLAGYLLARSVDRRRVEGEDLERLHLANDSMREARSLLDHGRTNVREDRAFSSGESARRGLGNRRLEDDSSLQTTVLSRAIWSGAGICGEHAHMARATHATRMPRGEEARLVHIPSFDPDHAWVESVPPDDVDSRRTNLERTIVLDTWFDGPAVFASDSQHYSSRRQSVPDGRSFTTQDAHVLDEEKRHAQDIAGLRNVDTLPPSRLREDFFYNASSAVSRTFHSRVQASLNREVSPGEAIETTRRSFMSDARDTLASLTSSKAARRRAAQSKVLGTVALPRANCATRSAEPRQQRDSPLNFGRRSRRRRWRASWPPLVESGLLPSRRPRSSTPPGN